MPAALQTSDDNVRLSPRLKPNPTVDAGKNEAFAVPTYHSAVTPR